MREILSRQNLKGEHDLLDQNPTAGCQEYNAAQNTYDVSRVPKRQKQWWND